MNDEDLSAVPPQARLPVSAPGRAALVFEGFGVRLGPALATAPLTLTLRPGELVMVEGPLGSGKSLLCEAIAGFKRPVVESFGALKWQEREGPLAEARLAPRVSFVPQDPRLAVLPTDRVGALLEAAFATLRGSPRPRAPSESQTSVLDRLGVNLGRIAHLQFKDLSSSERHRVLLALAVAEDAPLLVYDGFGEGLDPRDRRGVSSLLRDLLALGKCVVLTTRTRTLDLPCSHSVVLPPLHLTGTPADEEAPVTVERFPEEPLLEVENLRVTRGKLPMFGKQQAYPVDGATLFVRKRETLILLGAAGSGKTTLLEAIAGLSPRRSGRILLRGRDVTKVRGARAEVFRREVQLVFENASAVLDARYSVRELLEQARGLARRTSRWRKPRSLLKMTPTQWLTLLGVSTQVAELSGDSLSAGEAQRVDLARSLVLEPTLVLLDSPRVSGVDTDGGALASLIARKKAEGTSFLIATNEPALAASLGDRVAVMYAGRIIEWGSGSAVLNEPRHPATQALLGAEPGEAPDPTKPLRGCPFVAQCRRRELPRCDEAEPRSALLPDARGTQKDRRVACFFPLPLPSNQPSGGTTDQPSNQPIDQPSGGTT